VARVDTAVRRVLGPVLALLVLLATRDAAAFCRATTCDPRKEVCRIDDNGCVIDGAPLHWVSRCLSFGVQEAGSPRRNISFATADRIIGQAFQEWAGADCGGGTKPSFAVWDLGAPFGGIVCATPEFNPTKPNANVWMFRDDDWPYEGQASTLALTSTLFDTKTGALLDADVEINSFAVEITTTTTNVKKDLQSIATHEAGHFLGLAHSPVKEATMFAQYQAGDLSYRSLGADDASGVCAVYPPDRAAPRCSQPSPAHGFSRYCGGGVDGAASQQVRGCTCRLGSHDPGVPARSGVVLAALVVAAFAGRRGRL
jgi:hypothetical protein